VLGNYYVIHQKKISKLINFRKKFWELYFQAVLFPNITLSDPASEYLYVRD